MVRVDKINPAFGGAETSARARMFGLALSGLYQLTLSLSSYQLTLGTLPSELREPVKMLDSVHITSGLSLKTARVIPVLWQGLFFEPSYVLTRTKQAVSFCIGEPSLY